MPFDRHTLEGLADVCSRDQEAVRQLKGIVDEYYKRPTIGERIDGATNAAKSGFDVLKRVRPQTIVPLRPPIRVKPKDEQPA